MDTKPANWHKYDPEMTIPRLIVQECLHEPDGRFPITVTCDWLGGDILLEIVRSEHQVLAIYYLSEKTAELWASSLGFKFIEEGWQVIESTRGERPYVVGMAVPRDKPELLGEAVETSFDWLQPDVVATGQFAIPDYVCPES